MGSLKEFEDIVGRENIITAEERAFYEEKVKSGEMLKLSDHTEYSRKMLQGNKSDIDMTSLLSKYYTKFGKD